ncbi:hypothetical protein DFAR_1420005 [Desulfarculales bacterium]
MEDGLLRGRALGFGRLASRQGVDSQSQGKPTVREVSIVGNKAIDEKDLRDQIGIKPFGVFKPEALKEAEAKIIKLYHDKGFYDVKVASEIITTPSVTSESTSKSRKARRSSSKVSPSAVTNPSNPEIIEQMSTTQKGGSHGSPNPTSWSAQAGSGRGKDHRLLLQPRLHERPRRRAHGTREPDGGGALQYRGRPPLHGIRRSGERRDGSAPKGYGSVAQDQAWRMVQPRHPAPGHGQPQRPLRRQRLRLC